MQEGEPDTLLGKIKIAEMMRSLLLVRNHKEKPRTTRNYQNHQEPSEKSKSHLVLAWWTGGKAGTWWEHLSLHLHLHLNLHLKLGSG